MKTLILFTITLLSISSSWSQVSSNSNSKLEVVADQSPTMIFLGNIGDVKATGYSKYNDADAKVVQFLAGEGVNPYNSYLVITAGGSSQVFPILRNVNEVTRVTFSAIGEITVNYNQFTFDEREQEVLEKRHIKIKFTKNQDGQANLKIQILQP